MGKLTKRQRRTSLLAAAAAVPVYTAAYLVASLGLGAGVYVSALGAAVAGIITLVAVAHFTE